MRCLASRPLDNNNNNTCVSITFRQFGCCVAQPIIIKVSITSGESAFCIRVSHWWKTTEGKINLGCWEIFLALRVLYCLEWSRETHVQFGRKVEVYTFTSLISAKVHIVERVRYWIFCIGRGETKQLVCDCLS